MKTARQYEVLAKTRYLSALLRGGVRPERLCLHKTLLPADSSLDAADCPAGGRDGLNQWLADGITEERPKRVLDLGCGFGATLFALARRMEGQFVGLTQSAFLVKTAASLAEKEGRANELTFHEGEFALLSTLGSFDAIVAVESLSYFDELAEAARLLGEALRPKGSLWIVDDWLRKPLPEEHTDVRGLCETWGRRRLHTAEELEAAFAGKGFQLVENRDLTPQVPALRASASPRSGWLRLAARRLPGRQLRSLAAAYLGGFHLDRLYAASLMEYRFSHYVLP
ncbi:MAG: methyltransferase domain-containing protein [Verrucomicrobia bacterium]|jgi:SAM-dependent methyltransferase|nr:methyltransferase domain-containing protein [Verrucomicrobiota bacterium]